MRARENKILSVSPSHRQCTVNVLIIAQLSLINFCPGWDLNLWPLGWQSIMLTTTLSILVLMMYIVQFIQLELVTAGCSVLKKFFKLEILFYLVCFTTGQANQYSSVLHLVLHYFLQSSADEASDSRSNDQWATKSLMSCKQLTVFITLGLSCLFKWVTLLCF